MSLELEQKMEAILFAAGEPVELERLAEALGIDRTAARQQAECLMARLTQQGSPLQVLSLDGKYQLATRPEYAGVIQAATDWKRQQPLSQAAMEVLAVVAYNQPVTRAFVDQVRGVDSAGVVSTLVEKGLLEEAGRLELPAGPLPTALATPFCARLGSTPWMSCPPRPRRKNSRPSSRGNTPWKDEERGRTMVGWIFAGLCGLLLCLLSLPVVLQAEYNGELTVWVRYFFLRYQVFPRPPGEDEAPGGEKAQTSPRGETKEATKGKALRRGIVCPGQGAFGRAVAPGPVAVKNRCVL